MICNRCGAIIEPGHANCPDCGERIAPVRRPPAADAKAANPYLARIIEGADTVRHQAVREDAAVADDAEKTDETAPLRHATTSAPADEPARRSPVRRAGRNASERPVAPSAQPVSARAGQGRSRPQTERYAEARPAGEAAPRMVRRYEQDAIRPEVQGYENFNWLRLLVVSLVSVLLLTIATYLFLTQTYPGQYWLATIGRDASPEAYHQLGKNRMTDGLISSAVTALEIAQSKDPNNLDILIDLGRAYIGNGQTDEAETAFTRAIQYWPAYPEPYRRVIDIMLTQGRNYEALKTVELAIEETGAADFPVMYNQMIPPEPTVDAKQIGRRYDEEFDLTINYVEGGTLYYSLLGKDPVTEGEVYTGPIHMAEGSYRLVAVVEKDGMYSEQLIQSYVIIKPTPDMPYARLKTGTYDKVQYVPLSGGKDVVAIYYTTDGTEPTTSSRVYESPIPLRIGKTTIRAIAVNSEGKESNELRVEYVCNGKTNKVMSEQDTVDKLSLNGTTRSKFIEAHGEPQSEAADGSDDAGAYTRLTYSFGHAVFVAQSKDKDPVLVELSVTSPEFKGPRSTAVGSRMEDVLGAFHDGGGEAALDGHRVLYNFTTGKLGMIDQISPGKFKISYYTKLDSGHFIELTYYTADGLVERIEWLRYKP